MQIDWQQDTLTWLIDGTAVRTLKRSDATGSDGVSRYPSTPSRIELRYTVPSSLQLLVANAYTYPASPRPTHPSIWPAGINTSAQGTIDWAGGMINWNDPDYVAAGHFYALVQSVSVKCADASSNPAGAQSYVYGKNTSAFTPAVDVTNQTTVNNGAGPRAGAYGGVWGAVVAGTMLAVGALLV